MSSETKKCSPECEAFRCGQRAQVFKGSKAFCRWADDICEGPTCNYASCGKGRMLADGACGLQIKRKTREADPVEIPPLKSELSGRVQRKFKDVDLI